MDRLWQRMTEIYGHRWTSAFGMAGEEAQDTWRKGLGGVTVRQIKDASERCISRADGWPPTLPEFRELCSTSANPHDTNAAAYQRNVDVLGAPGAKRLTDQRTTDTRRDHARPFLQTLKAAVTGRKDGDA